MTDKLIVPARIITCSKKEIEQEERRIAKATERVRTLQAALACMTPMDKSPKKRSTR